MSIECIVICVIYESLNKIIKEITLYIVLKSLIIHEQFSQ